MYARDRVGSYLRTSRGTGAGQQQKTQNKGRAAGGWILRQSVVKNQLLIGDREEKKEREREREKRKRERERERERERH